MAKAASPTRSPASADASRDGAKANWCGLLRAESKRLNTKQGCDVQASQYRYDEGVLIRSRVRPLRGVRAASLAL
jgi:hypothetical protein